MEPRLARGLALVLVVAAVALVLAIRSRPLATTPPVAARHVDAPLGRISCDELPVKAPDPDEIADDERDRPYHLLVRVVDFKTLEPIDVDATRLVVRGAGDGTHVGKGEYYFQNLPLALTAVILFDAQDPAGPQPAGPGRHREKMAERNPVHMARGAITTCDLIAIGAHDLEETVELRGLVEESATRQPVDRATIVCGTQRALSDASGRFAFDARVTWDDVLHTAGVVCEGYEPCPLRGLSLPVAWIRRLRTEKTALFRLRPARKVAAAPLIPPLAK